MTRYLFVLFMFFSQSSFAIDCNPGTDIFNLIISPAYALTDPCNPPHYDCVDNPFYATDGNTFVDMVRAKTDDFKNSSLVSFITNFFSVYIYGSCAPIDLSIDYFNWQYSIDFICSDEVNDAVSSLGYIFLALASFYAIRLVMF